MKREKENVRRVVVVLQNEPNFYQQIQVARYFFWLKLFFVRSCLRLHEAGVEIKFSQTATRQCTLGRH
jgi:hypothetical protein